MRDKERIKIDKGFVEKQIPLTKTLKELANLCNCGTDKMRHFIIDNGLYKYYCEQHNISYDPEKEKMTCAVCGFNKDINKYKGIPYCKKHYLQMARYGKIIERTIYDDNEIIVEGDIARIILRDKYQNIVCETIIDTEDVDKIKNYKWYLGSGDYCVTKGINPKTGIDISNVIFNDYENKYDHISHDRLDNRKINLRPITSHQNAMNMGKKNTNTSGVIGVSKQLQKREWTGRWCSTLMYNYNSIWLGVYSSFDEAVHARLKGEVEYFGEYSPNYDSETQTIRLEYINPVDNVKHYVEYSLGGELLHDNQIAA